MIGKTSNLKDSWPLDQVTIYPGQLHGKVRLPISKSLAHRVILAKALAAITAQTSGAITLDGHWDHLADDIIRTLDGAAALIEGFEETGAGMETSTAAHVGGMETSAAPMDKAKCHIYCKDSGTTLRMIMPIACALYDSVAITVTRQLAKRPMDPLIEVLKSGGCEIHITENPSGTFTYGSFGKFKGGLCQIAGNISSQYISGLLYALPLTENGGEIRLTTQLASKPYLDMTLAVLKDFGIQIDTKTENGLLVFHIAGKQQFKNTQVNIDQGDWSAAAFFAVANSLGSQVEMENLDFNSLQGDKIVYSLIDKIKNDIEPVIDLTDYPDLFPILAIFASYQKKTTQFVGLGRLRIKESDRIMSTTAMLGALQCEFQVCEDNSVKVYGTGRLAGGTVDSYQDHRIAMAAAIGATGADGPVTILGSSCCDKSYPGFFQDYVNLGGKID